MPDQFPTSTAFAQHLYGEHDALDAKIVSAKIRRNVVSVSRSAHECPLCFDELLPLSPDIRCVSDNAVPDRASRVSFLEQNIGETSGNTPTEAYRLTPSQASTTVSTTDTPASNEVQVKEDKRMAQHIAQHLKGLSFISLQSWEDDHFSADSISMRSSEVEQNSEQNGNITVERDTSRSFSTTREKKPVPQTSNAIASALEMSHRSGSSEGSVHSGDIYTLGDKIRMGMIRSGGGNSEFLPSDQIAELITVGSVSQELMRFEVHSDLDAVAHAVVDIVSTPRGTSSRQKLFAILCLLEMAPEIEDFIKEMIFDEDLPFSFSTVIPSDVYRNLPSGGEERPVQLFRAKDKWRLPQLDYFNSSQGKFLAPYFEFSIGDNRKVLHYSLSKELVLPFVQDIFKDGGSRGEIPLAIHRMGGYSAVRKVKIHPAHHNAHSDSVRPFHVP